MAKPVAVQLAVEIHIDEEVRERVSAAQERFNSAVSEMQAATSELQLATYALQDSISATATPV